AGLRACINAPKGPLQGGPFHFGFRLRIASFAGKPCRLSEKHACARMALLLTMAASKRLSVQLCASTPAIQTFK
ncbi:MAG TPA: hypothetical protein VIQ01_08635, partial [Burkholderiales bacterium]